MITVSYSELSDYRQCPLKHYLGYKQRWTKPPRPDGALARGTLWHDVMEVHYSALKAGSLWAEVKRQAYDLIERARRNADPNADLIEWMYDGYLERWGRDSQWKVQSVEGKEFVPLRGPDGKDSEFQLKVKLDLVVFDLETGGYWVVDHKSGSDLPKQQDLDIDDQFGLYVMAMRRLGVKVQGSLHNAARTKQNMGDLPGATRGKAQTLAQRFDRTYLNRTETELRSIEIDAWATATAAYSDLPLYSSPDPRSCGWKCSFKEAHLAMREGRSEKDALEGYEFVQDWTRH